MMMFFIIEFALQLSVNDVKNFPQDPSDAVDYADKWVEHLFMCKKPLPMPEYVMINKTGAFDSNVVIPPAPKKPFYAYPKGATAEEKTMIRDRTDQKHLQDLEEHASQVGHLMHYQRLVDKEVSKNGLRHAVMKIVHNINNGDPLPGSMCTRMYNNNNNNNNKKRGANSTTKAKRRRYHRRSRYRHKQCCCRCGHDDDDDDDDNDGDDDDGDDDDETNTSATSSSSSSSDDYEDDDDDDDDDDDENYKDKRRRCDNVVVGATAAGFLDDEAIEDNHDETGIY